MWEKEGMANTGTGRGGKEVNELTVIEEHTVPQTLHALSHFIFVIICEVEVLSALLNIHSFNRYLLSAC